MYECFDMMWMLLMHFHDALMGRGLSQSPPPTRAISPMSKQSRVTSRCDVAHSGRESLHHFLPVLLRFMLPLISIMTMTSLRYGRIFCPEFQKIDGTEYLMGSTELVIFWKLLNLEACNLVGVYKIENK